jgi:3-hydroxyacyl-[acyl-carrier-protein] dehydratase
MDVATPTHPILQRIELILRRDLKLGADIAIPPDMPFFGGDVDLDSLDILLLVTSIEKEFGVKIPSEVVGKEVFQNVGSLARYIETAAAAATSRSDDRSEPSRASDPLTLLPHGEAFRFVSRVTNVRAGESAEAIWSVLGDEAFFAGHFPGNPIVPGVLITEALAQTCGLAGASKHAAGMLAHVDVRFARAVVPPADIALHANFMRTMDALEQFDVRASVGGEVVASGSITLHRHAAGGNRP